MDSATSFDLRHRHGVAADRVAACQRVNANDVDDRHRVHVLSLVVEPCMA